MKFKSEKSALFYRILLESKSRILRSLEAPQIIGMNPHGEVTRFFDKAIENIIVEKLRSKGFEGTIISEELGELRGGSPGWVYLDPLDGSLNASRGIDFYSLSIAYASEPSVEKLEAGLIWDIPRDVIYFAEKGQGAFKLKNKKPIRLSIPPETDEIVIDSGLTTNEHCLRELRSRGTLRRMGSIALSAALVAEGKFDGIFDMGDLKVTDVAAAYLIIKESGGHVFIDISDISKNFRVRFIAARNREIFDWLLGLYNEYIKAKNDEQ